MPQPTMKRMLPSVGVSRADSVMLQRLVSTLVARNMDQCSALPTTVNDTPADSARWRELRKADRVRIYEERATADMERSGEGLVPSLLLLGTLPGTVEDAMLAVMAATDEELTLQSRVLGGGVVESKLLQSIVKPTSDEPFEHVGVTWRLFDTHDYVCVDATGVVVHAGERVGYWISHSLRFNVDTLPDFERQSVDRGNRSVCTLFRQHTDSHITCYMRGFYDFEVDGDLITHSVAMQGIASQWLAMVRLSELSTLKKLRWLGSRSQTSLHMSDKIDKLDMLERKLKVAVGGCEMCSKGLATSLLRLGGTKTCLLCHRSVCHRCSVKRLTVEASEQLKKRSLCLPCDRKVAATSAELAATNQVIVSSGYASSI